MPSNPAPGDLERVRRFVNTWDAEDFTEVFDTPAALRDWLGERELIEPGARVSAKDVERARDVREALRAVLLAHHGEPLDPSAARRLDDAARRARLEVRFDAAGRAHVEPAARGVDGAIGRLLAIAHEAMRADTWDRLKVCPADDCQVAFYDRSRNHSAVWCDMRVCGNRAKVREYRERTKRGGRP